jgi:hypothetical protein
MNRTRVVAFAIASLVLLVTPWVEADVISAGPYTVPASTDPFVVPIQITGGVEVTSWSFDLTYDPADVQINTNCDPLTDPFCSLLMGPVTEGSFFSAGAPSNLLVPGFIYLDLSEDQTGLLFGVEGAYGGFPPAPSDDGILDYVEFVKTATGTDESSISVINATVVSAVPEPAMLVLLGLGLGAALGVHYHRRRARRSTSAPRRCPLG